ncbi:type II toxin-antitoxin system antitoxin SocA domain-containing protein, partial [Xanthobacter sp. 91]|uniref:Panacea domain-containing protein n=1 Tax=Xanthobacter sp. 91 TaxID=1117244 RepID=UPI000496C912
MTHDGRAIANFVLDQAEVAGLDVTPMALQKIVYFCHAWTLVEIGRPLIRHSFEAWEHGPVLQYLYREFKEFGASPIRRRARRINLFTGREETVPYEFDAPTLDLLTRVTAIYARLSASTLRDLTHAPGGPWSKVWNHDGKIRPGMRIHNDDIEQFYSRMPLSACVQ